MNTAVMQAVPAAHEWHPPPNGHEGRLPPSQAQVTLRHLLRQRAKGSAGAFPPTAPGQLFVFVLLLDHP